jgi:ABC-type dipeptide/oligopeptide/nickel transport system permease subunit
MVSLNRSYLPSAPWMVLFPGFAIALTVMLFNIFGDMLRDALDPNIKV